MSTYELNDGAPAGRYAVTITWPGANPRSNGEGDEEIQGPDQLGGRYSNPQRPPGKLKCVISPSSWSRLTW
ncbi:MAG TPA: hypothetical protein VG125_31165, partial [Pirellulales bacterium]|nr:hypothetical protein [Pirellulales bacterium]